MHSRNAFVRLSVAVVLGALVASTTPVALETPASAQNVQVIKIGIDLPVSGGDAAQGIPTQQGAMLAIDDANAHHVLGAFKLQADALDDAVAGTHDPAQGAQNVKQFVSDSSVLAMFGPFNSNVAKAEIPISNDAGLAMIAASTTNPGLTKGETQRNCASPIPTSIPFSASARPTIAKVPSARVSRVSSVTRKCSSSTITRRTARV